MTTAESNMLPWSIWRRAAAEDGVDGDLANLYRRLDEQVALRGPTCWISGRCCNFDAYGHLLYVTGLEVAWVVRQVGQSTTTAAALRENLNEQPDAPRDTQAACPFQTGTLCGIHAVRPLGCRVFFCEQGTQEWQQELYESFLTDLRSLHDVHDLPYRYLEWREALRLEKEDRLGQGNERKE
jgi:Fe-S-cluster containining protein